MKDLNDRPDDMNEQDTEAVLELEAKVNKAGGRVFNTCYGIFFELKGKFHEAFVYEGRIYWSNKYDLPSFVDQFEADFNLH